MVTQPRLRVKKEIETKLERRTRDPDTETQLETYMALLRRGEPRIQIKDPNPGISWLGWGAYYSPEPSGAARAPVMD